MKMVELGSLLDLSDAGVWGDEDLLNGISVLRSTNFTNHGELDFTNLTFRQVDGLKRSSKRLRSGDILLEKSGGGPKQPVGRVCLFKNDEEHLFGNFIARLRPNSSVLSEYLFYFLWYIHSIGKTQNYQKQTTGLRNLEFKRYLGIKVPIVSLEDQARIVQNLNACFDVIELRKSATTKSQDLKKSIFFDLFGDISRNNKGWEIKNFGSIVENLDGKRRPIKSSDRDKRQGEYRYYGASGVIDYIDEFIFDGEYLLIAEDGANLVSRSTPIAFRANGKFWVNNHAHIVRSNGLASLTYLEFLLNERGVEDAITGSAQPKLNQANLNKLSIPMPPLDLQTKFSGLIEEIGEMETSQFRFSKQSLDVYEAMLQGYFHQ